MSEIEVGQCSSVLVVKKIPSVEKCDSGHNVKSGGREA